MSFGYSMSHTGSSPLPVPFDHDVANASKVRTDAQDRQWSHSSMGIFASRWPSPHLQRLVRARLRPRDLPAGLRAQAVPAPRDQQPPLFRVEPGEDRVPGCDPA